MSRIFLSYRREDSGGHAGRLFDRLAAAFGEEHVFIDVEMQPGTDYEAAIERTIESCDAVVVVIGPRWLESRSPSGARRLDDPDDLVRREAAAALRRPERTTIPVLVQGAAMPSRESLPEPLAPLARRNALEISDSRFRFDTERLIAALREALESSGAGPEPPPPNARRTPRWAGRPHAARGMAAVAVAAVLVALLLYPGWLRDQPAGGASSERRQAVVPNLVGQASAFKAEQKLQAARLKLDPAQKKQLDTTVAPGTVIGQTPKAGTKAREGGTVTILVATTTDKVDVPKVVGLTLADAEKVLRARNLKLGRMPRPLDLTAKITGQIPAADEVVEEGTQVDVVYPHSGG